MANHKKQILLTNDDGIRSPGLWAAAEALAVLGYVTVAAPREQSSGTGRSLPNTSTGIIQPEKMLVHGKEWTVYAVSGTPAQAALHGILEICPSHPDLVVSGINYGENVGSGVTISGTVGAAMEAASLGIPALAISLETPPSYHLSYSRDIDFATAAVFTQRFARALLELRMPPDFDLLKVEIPSDATPETPWEVTRQSKVRYYVPIAPQRSTWDVPANVGYCLSVDENEIEQGSDVYTLRFKRHVSVTPLSLDLTARVDFDAFTRLLETMNGK